MYRIMFLGQKPIGEACLDVLEENLDGQAEVKAVVSNQFIENVWWKSNRLFEYAVTNEIDFIGNEKRHSDEIKSCIAKNDINFIISVGHKWVIDKDILDMVNGNAVNLHLAMLPMYQGNFTFNHAILNHEKKYGVTLHYMEESVDTGDYIFMPSFEVTSKDTAYSLYIKSFDLGITTFRNFIKLLIQNKRIPRKRMYGIPRFYGRHSIDGKREISDISNEEELAVKARAFYFPPFENAYIFIDKKKYYIIPET